MRFLLASVLYTVYCECGGFLELMDNLETGEITDGHIRYLTIRADVLMGLAREWPNGDTQQFVAALARSALRYSRDSFETYKASNRFPEGDFLSSVAPVAAQLGWGSWRVTELEANRRRITVRNSPFASGFGRSSHPVCGAICGVLEAMGTVGYGRPVRVTEEVCAAQAGGSECIFGMSSDQPATIVR